MSYLVFGYLNGLQMKVFETIKEAEDYVSINGGNVVRTLDLKLVEPPNQRKEVI